MRFAKEISHLYAHEHSILRRSRASPIATCTGSRSYVDPSRERERERMTAASLLSRENSEDDEDEAKGAREISARPSSAIIRAVCRFCALLTLCVLLPL